MDRPIKVSTFGCGFMGRNVTRFIGLATLGALPSQWLPPMMQG